MQNFDCLPFERVHCPALLVSFVDASYCSNGLGGESSRRLFAEAEALSYLWLARYLALPSLLCAKLAKCILPGLQGAIVRPVLTATDPGTQQTYEQDWHRWDPNNPFPADGSSAPRAAAMPSSLFAPPQQNASEAPSAQPDLTRFDFQGMPSFLSAPPQVCCCTIRLACTLSPFTTSQVNCVSGATLCAASVSNSGLFSCDTHPPYRGGKNGSHICFKYAALYLHIDAYVTASCLRKQSHSAACKLDTSMIAQFRTVVFHAPTVSRLAVLTFVRRLLPAPVGTSRSPCTRSSSSLPQTWQTPGSPPWALTTPPAAGAAGSTAAANWLPSTRKRQRRS